MAPSMRRALGQEVNSLSKHRTSPDTIGKGRNNSKQDRDKKGIGDQEQKWFRSLSE